MTSERWNEETTAGGYDVTNSVAIYLPTERADGLFIARIEYKRAWKIAKQLSLGDTVVVFQAESEEDGSDDLITGTSHAIAFQTEPKPSL
jgi:hypothetical protein